MTTLKNRPQTALVVIDVQNGVVAGTHERDTVVAHIHELVDKARLEHVPVVWVQHADEQLVRGSDDWQIVPELTPGDGVPIVPNGYPDSFEETTLESVLSGLGVGRLVIARSTARQGHRAHQPVLGVPHRARANGRDRRDRRGGLRCVADG
jgi:nicotinamidase-related amidase